MPLAMITTTASCDLARAGSLAAVRICPKSTEQHELGSDARLKKVPIVSNVYLTLARVVVATVAGTVANAVASKSSRTLA